ncbi:hypothetical protein GGTG_08405 [Gaeumannomyces tritici R3-111a-1]|uniref:Uncharacterized protein n=1 Tax=Gaeumannomyces tritici (strain R3-111a-1) TaxID=644352 RepID=J3P4G8_GAET3|nr:hypothetical protein GGTG_08405 [Gaeumannomyces tritici R3-111a-1]EJT74565.1 hypothetical protein GGTG_08405 [Gaeumannomyces tritici R3-111a-1]
MTVPSSRFESTPRFQPCLASLLIGETPSHLQVSANCPPQAKPPPGAPIMDSQANKGKSLLDVIKEAADTGSSSSGVQRAPKNRADYTSDDASLGQPQGTVAPAVTPVGQPTSPARDEDQASADKPADAAATTTEYHDWGAGDDEDSDDSHAASAAPSAPAGGNPPSRASGAKAAAATFCPTMTVADVSDVADGQSQQQRRRTSMFARMPYQRPAPAADEAGIAESAEDQDIARKDSHQPDDVSLQTRRKSEGGQLMRPASGPPASSPTDADNGL